MNNFHSYFLMENCVNDCQKMHPQEKFIISEFIYHKHAMPANQPQTKFKLKHRHCDSFSDNFSQYLRESTQYPLWWYIVYRLTINEIYIKWSNQPIIMSVSPSSIQKSDIPIAAVIICTVNQAQTNKAEKNPPNSNNNFI